MWPVELRALGIVGKLLAKKTYCLLCVHVQYFHIMMLQIFHNRIPETTSTNSTIIFPITRHSVSKECNRIRTVSQTRKWEPRKGPKKRVDDREAELVSFANEISRRAARLERLQRAHDLDLPPVDWTRYHLQLLFVDR